MWFVYILQCSDNSFYTWVTTDLIRRELEHNSSTKWAKYTKMRRPVKIIYSLHFSSRSEACKEEYRIKQLTRINKEKLIEKKNIY